MSAAPWLQITPTVLLHAVKSLYVHVQVDFCQLLPAAAHCALGVRVAEGPLLKIFKPNLEQHQQQHTTSTTCQNDHVCKFARSKTQQLQDKDTVICLANFECDLCRKHSSSQRVVAG